MNPFSSEIGEKETGLAALHDRLRTMILNGELAPGSPLPQETLARSLGVSRTPLREVLRMLQEEGLVQAGRYQRCRVSSFDPESLDALYSSRILVEVLGIRLTIPRLQQTDLDALTLALTEMRTARDPDAWEEPHRRFHQFLVAHAGEQLCETIARYADRSERYRRMYGHTEPHARSVSLAEHGSLVEACVERNQDIAAQRLARHLARTALAVIAQVAPEYEPIAVRTALRIVQADTSGSEEHARSKRRTKGESSLVK